MTTATRPETIPDGYEWDEEEARLITGMAAEMNEKGDSKIKWDKNNPAEVEGARAAFDKLVGDKKFAAFKLSKFTDSKGERITRFDPDAERILFVPPMQGG